LFSRLALRTLCTSHLEAIIGLVATASEQGEIFLRKRELLTRIVRLVSADHWLWFHGVVDAQGASCAAEGALDGIEGQWLSQTQRMGVLPCWGPAVLPVRSDSRFGDHERCGSADRVAARIGTERFRTRRRMAFRRAGGLCAHARSGRGGVTSFYKQRNLQANKEIQW